jgi:hypothetical protein
MTTTPVIANQTPKEKYEALVQNIMEVVFNISNITDGDMKQVADDCKGLWDLKDNLLQIRRQIEGNEYYRRHVAVVQQRKLMSLQEKSQSDDWINCPDCDRRVKKGSGLTNHKKTDVCKDIRLSKGLTLTKRCIPHKDYPIYHIVNHTITKMIKLDFPRQVIIEEPKKFRKQIWMKNGKIPVLLAR